MKKIFLLFIVIALVAFPKFILAQQNNFKSCSIEDGLPQSTVYSIFNDSRGYLWLGTDGGVIARLDGIHYFNLNKKPGLAENNVRRIIEDKTGNI